MSVLTNSFPLSFSCFVLSEGASHDISFGHLMFIALFSSTQGGGILGLEKGTDSGLTAAELWLSRHKNAKRGSVLLLYCMIRELSNILHHITIVYIQICS